MTTLLNIGKANKLKRTQCKSSFHFRGDITQCKRALPLSRDVACVSHPSTGLQQHCSELRVRIILKCWKGLSKAPFHKQSIWIYFNKTQFLCVVACLEYAIWKEICCRFLNSPLINQTRSSWNSDSRAILRFAILEFHRWIKKVYLNDWSFTWKT